MKNTIASVFAFAAICVMFSSCSSLEFVNPQPVGVKTMKVIDESLLGTWIDNEGDEIIIGEKKIVTPETELIINQDYIVKSQNGRYYFNVGEKEAWMVIIVQLDGNVLRAWSFQIETEEQAAELESITSATPIYDDEGSLTGYIVDPTAEEFKKLEKASFLEEMDPWTRK
jgi:hypothetical protein